MLVVVVAKKELRVLKEAVKQADQHAFISISSGVSTNTIFYEW